MTHKVSMGAVDMSFPRTPLERLEPLRQYLEPDMTIVQTGRSASIRVSLAEVKCFQDFASEKAKFTEAGNACHRLLSFYLTRKQIFDLTLSVSA